MATIYQTPQPGMPILWMMLMPTWAMKTKKKAMKLKELSLLWRIKRKIFILRLLQYIWQHVTIPNAHFGLPWSNKSAPDQQVFRHESTTKSRIKPQTRVINGCDSALQRAKIIKGGWGRLLGVRGWSSSLIREADWGSGVCGYIDQIEPTCFESQWTADNPRL